MRKWFFKKGHTINEKNLDLEKIKDLYTNKRKSANEIAKSMNVSCGTITKRLKKEGIKIRKGKECGMGRKKILLDENKLKDLYVNQKKSTVEIGNIFGVSHKTISKTLRQINVEIRSGSENLKYWHKKHEHPMKNPEFSKKMGETKKRLYKEGKIKTWNEGLTKETDERVKRCGEKESKTKKRLFKEGRLSKNIGAKGKDNYMFGRKGKLSFAWKGGIAFEPYDKKFNDKFKRAIRKRDNQVCMLCGIHREKLWRALDVHHINYNKKLSIPQNCLSLCHPCHMKANTNRKH